MIIRQQYTFCSSLWLLVFVVVRCHCSVFFGVQGCSVRWFGIRCIWLCVWFIRCQAVVQTVIFYLVVFSVHRVSDVGCVHSVVFIWWYSFVSKYKRVEFYEFVVFIWWWFWWWYYFTASLWFVYFLVLYALICQWFIAACV